MGYDKVIFLDQPLDDNLLCPICFDVYEEATTACASGHTFCKPCLERGGGNSSSNNDKCPTCRADRMSLPNRPLRGMIEGLRVHCGEGKCKDGGAPDKKMRLASGDANDMDENENLSSCEWTGKLGQLDDHKKACPFASIRCPEICCGKRFRRMDLEQHRKECQFRKVECSSCQAIVSHNRLNFHQKSECPKAQVKCKFCGEEMARELLGKKGALAQEHFSTFIEEDKKEYFKCSRIGHYAECPKVILKCEFFDYGCEAEFAREDAGAHHAENAQYHAALVNRTLGRLSGQMHWDLVTIMWPIHCNRIRGDQRKVLRSSVTDSVSQYNLYLKLSLRGPNDPIEISVCSESINCNPVHPKAWLKEINIRVTDPFMNDESTFAEFDSDKERDLDTESGNRGAFEYSVMVDKRDENSDGHKYTRSDVMQSLNESHNDKLVIRASFRIHKVRSVFVRCA